MALSTSHSASLGLPGAAPASGSFSIANVALRRCSVADRQVGRCTCPRRGRLAAASGRDRVLSLGPSGLAAEPADAVSARAGCAPCRGNRADLESLRRRRSSDPAPRRSGCCHRARGRQDQACGGRARAAGLDSRSARWPGTCAGRGGRMLQVEQKDVTLANNHRRGSSTKEAIGTSRGFPIIPAFPNLQMARKNPA